MVTRDGPRVGKRGSRSAAPAAFTAVQLVRRRREGRVQRPEEFTALVNGLLTGTVTDYQMAAWLMAACFRPLTRRETVSLTRAMLASGRTLRWGPGLPPRIDKHSTGGVGDKVSLCLAPLVAAAGVLVPMVSGRGLGHTGGTLDKLEAIPGFQVTLSARRFQAVVRRVGAAMVGQTAELAPADRRIYALRDVTATVESVPLIVASILSKKLAAGLDGLVLDVKHGGGAFLPSLPEARRLARALVEVGADAGLAVTALITDMDAPLGYAIGNALETREALEVLLGGGPEPVRELTLALGTEMLLLARVEREVAAARARLLRLLGDGSAARVMERLVRAQGGDARVVREPDRLPRAPYREMLLAPRAGFVRRIDARALGEIAIELGAGRVRADQAVDPRVGFVLRVAVGDRVAAGAPLVELHARDAASARALASRVSAAFVLGPEAPRPRALISERLSAVPGRGVVC